MHGKRSKTFKKSDPSSASRKKGALSRKKRTKGASSEEPVKPTSVGTKKRGAHHERTVRDQNALERKEDEERKLSLDWYVNQADHDFFPDAKFLSNISIESIFGRGDEDGENRSEKRKKYGYEAHPPQGDEETPDGDKAPCRYAEDVEARLAANFEKLKERGPLFRDDPPPSSSQKRHVVNINKYAGDKMKWAWMTVVDATELFGRRESFSIQNSSDLVDAYATRHFDLESETSEETVQDVMSVLNDNHFVAFFYGSNPYSIYQRWNKVVKSAELSGRRVVDPKIVLFSDGGNDHGTEGLKKARFALKKFASSQSFWGFERLFQNHVRSVEEVFEPGNVKNNQEQAASGIFGEGFRRFLASIPRETESLLKETVLDFSGALREGGKLMKEEYHDPVPLKSILVHGRKSADPQRSDSRRRVNMSFYGYEGDENNRTTRGDESFSDRDETVSPFVFCAEYKKTYAEEDLDVSFFVFYVSKFQPLTVRGSSDALCAIRDEDVNSSKLVGVEVQKVLCMLKSRRV